LLLLRQVAGLNEMPGPQTRELDDGPQAVFSALRQSQGPGLPI